MLVGVDATTVKRGHRLPVGCGVWTAEEKGRCEMSFDMNPADEIQMQTPDEYAIWQIESGVTSILEGLGVDLSDHNFADTPRRYREVLQEMFRPPETEIPVFDESYTDMVLMRNHTFYTLCPHHLLPVKLTAALAYIPGGKVIGASKLMRMMHDVNRYPMTQEMLTASIMKRVDQLTEGTSRGAAIHMQGEHGCFQIRGVRSMANMVTLKFSGAFEESEEKQRRFVELLSI